MHHSPPSIRCHPMKLRDYLCREKALSEVLLRVPKVVEYGVTVRYVEEPQATILAKQAA